MRIEQVPYSELRLFDGILPDYVSDYARLSGYYTANPAEADDLRRRAEAALSRKRPREAAARALDEYNRRLGAGEETPANIAKLRGEDCAAVVTGQQPGLFGGPLYTVYKAMTAIRLARLFDEDLGVPCVPVFWNASDGHDAGEYASITMPGRDGRPTRRRLRDIPGFASAFDVEVTRECRDLLNEYCSSLPETEFSAEVVETLKSAYEGNLAESFSRLMLGLFSRHGLILMEPRLLRREAAGIIAREIETRGESSASIREAKRSLKEKGYTPPVTGEEEVKAFIYEGKRRRRIRASEGGFSSREREYSTGEILELVESEPERFSPDAALRPIVQDALLPTAAYVAGPTETAYFAQLKKAYEFFDVPMPAIYPRVSATLVEAKIARLLANFNIVAKGFLNGARPQDNVENAEGNNGLEKEFAAMLDEMERRLKRLRGMALKYEPTLEKPFDRSERSIRRELEKLRDRAASARLNRLGTGRRQRLRVGDALLPGGKPQERVYTMWPWLCKYGVELTDGLLERLPFQEFHHTLIYFG